MLTLHQSLILENVVSRVGIGIVVTDVEGKMLQINDSAAKLLGSAIEQVPLREWPRKYGLYLSDGLTLCPDDESPLLRAIKGEEVENIEYFISNEESAGRWCGVNLSPLRTEAGDIEGAVLIIQDITERKKLSDAVLRSNEALQQFAWVAAHDLQEPLRTVTGFLELLEEHMGENLDDKSRHYLTRIGQAAKRMRNLINDLLAYSRIQTRQSDPALVDCNEVVDDCIKNLEASIQSSGAVFQIASLPTVFADRGRLSQLFQNLIGNALKFTVQGTAPVVRVSVQKQSQQWLFAIEDNGVGIDMQFAERIFVAFQRLNPAGEQAGTGIGLTICKKIVEQHGGRIWVQSQPGKGSTFYFTLRAAPDGANW